MFYEHENLLHSLYVEAIVLFSYPSSILSDISLYGIIGYFVNPSINIPYVLLYLIFNPIVGLLLRVINKSLNF